MGFASLEVWATQPLFMWQQALDQFLSYYDPCDDIEESTQQFTTPQLLRMLDQHCGGYIDIEEFVQYLQDKKFTYQYDLDLTFNWLFKAKEITP